MTDDSRIIEEIMKVLAENQADPYLIARQIFREVFKKEIEAAEAKWQKFGWAQVNDRKGH